MTLMIKPCWIVLALAFTSASALADDGPDADALRARVFPQWAQDPTRRLNLSGLGPRLDVSEEARRRFFCEDVAGA